MTDELQIFMTRKAPSTSAALMQTSKTVSITQGHEYGFPLIIQVSPFVPETGDTTEYKWQGPDQVEHVMDMPPYYIHNTELTARKLRQYAIDARESYIDNLLQNKNPIIRTTFEMASRCLKTRHVSTLFYGNH